MTSLLEDSKTQCKDLRFRVKTTNGFSDLISQSIGVIKGCPLSPLLFNLVIQGLLIGLDNNEGGYTFNNQLHLNYALVTADGEAFPPNDVVLSITSSAVPWQTSTYLS